MKKFLLNSFIFFVILCVPNIFLFNFAHAEYYQNYNDAPEKNFTEFIFADSHGLPIENFAEEYGVFNFSAGSESYIDMKRKLNFLINKNYNVENVYITVNEHTLSPYREMTNNNDKSEVFFTIRDYDNIFEYYKQRYVFYYGAIFQPKVRDVLKIQINSQSQDFFSQKSDTPTDIEAWSKLSPEERNSKSLERIAYQFGYAESSVLLENTLLEIIEICRKNNIELVGVKFPIAKELIDNLGDKNYGADKIFIQNDVEIIDVRELFIENPEYFKDHDHLNSVGGKILADILFGQNL